MGDALGHHPRVSIGNGYVDLKLITDDAIYRDDEGTEHVVEWVTQQDVDLARRITEMAADHKVDPDPASVSDIEPGPGAAERHLPRQPERYVRRSPSSRDQNPLSQCDVSDSLSTHHAAPDTRTERMSLMSRRPATMLSASTELEQAS